MYLRKRSNSAIELIFDREIEAVLIFTSAAIPMREN